MGRSALPVARAVFATLTVALSLPVRAAFDLAGCLPNLQMRMAWHRSVSSHRLGGESRSTET